MDELGRMDPQVAQEVYGRIYEWYGTNAAVITDSGAELLGPELLSLSHTMLTANGLPQPDTAPLILYSPGVDVDVYDLAPC